MYDVPVDGLRLLSEVDIAAMAGGYEPNLPGEGSGGPSEGELIIENLLANWGAETDYRLDNNTLFMLDGAMFFDSDDNGYYDYLEVATDGGRFVFEPETNTWKYKPNQPNGS